MRATSEPPSTTTVDMYVKREKIYPRAIRGRFARWRWVMVLLTQLVYYGLPWLWWNDRQAVLFDLETPRFYVFGLVLHPQDLIFLAALLVISALALFFFTAMAGRLWCGYACPQSVYTEIFLWIERHTEGDRAARMRLDRTPWTVRKLLSKGGKHTAWALFSLYTGLTFVGYFVPIRGLAIQALRIDMEAWPLFWLVFYALATYGNAGWMREQICKYVCPYARFQSTLIDADSWVIAYDARRGEPRGSRPRSVRAAALDQGSCVDCTLCVQVCPTGIDIRQGLQNECIGCAACIDVCDTVMDKLGDARGLIRYTTANGLEKNWTHRRMLKRIWRPRVLVYGALLIGSISAFIYGLQVRGPLVVDVMRDRGGLARVGGEGRVENVYRVQLLNRLERSAAYHVRVSGLQGLRVEPAAEWLVTPGEVRSFTLTLVLAPDEALALKPGAHPVDLELREVQASAAVVHERTTFILPR